MNLIGEHTDTSGGFVFPAALGQGITVVAARCPGPTTVTSAHGDTASFEAATVAPGDVEGWARYPAGVAWALRGLGVTVPEVQAFVSSDLPIGAGLSSSAALEGAFALVWSALGGWSIDRRTLALACQRAENEFVGVRCGVMDQMAAFFGEEGHALLIDTTSLDVRPVPWPSEWTLVVCDTGQRHDLAAGEEYNARRADVERAMAAIGVASLRDTTPEEVEARSGEMGPVAARRALHVTTENRRCLAMEAALLGRDRARVGELMAAGHDSLRNLFEVTTIELDRMVESALASPGCIGARMTGAGFGGSVVAAVETVLAGEFLASVDARYRERVPGSRPSFLLTRPGAGGSVGVPSLEAES